MSEQCVVVGEYEVGYLPWRARFEKRFWLQSHLKRKEVIRFIERELKIARRDAIKEIQKIIKKEVL